MKINRYKKNSLGIVAFFLLCTSVILFTSCQDDEADMPPSITRIRAINPELADSSFTVGLPGQQIVIEGTNLSGIQKIYFNDYSATFSPVYNTDTHVIVQIPINTPTPDRNPNVSNTIRIHTGGGIAEYSFSVNPPAPIISSVYNENTRPGDLMELSGKFLLPVNEVIFPGGISGKNIQKDNEGKHLLVEVPEGVSEAGPLTVVSPYGSSTSSFIVNNTKGPGLFANFNTIGNPEFGWGFWGAIRTDDKDLFPGADGFYIHSTFANVGANDPGWWTNKRNVALKNYDKVVVPVSELGKPLTEFVLKFEINTRVPIREGVIFLIRFKDGKAGSYEWHPYALSSNGVFDTKNKWKTVSVPLGELKKNTIGEILEPSGVIGLCNIGIISKEYPISEFDAAFDNIRIEQVMAQ